MNLSGSISDWTVPDLLNMLRVTSKTASLHISGPRTGVIHFRDGRVAGAVIEGRGVVEGEPGSRIASVDALFAFSGMAEGSFELKAYSGPEVEGWEVDDLVADMERLRELETDVAGSGLAESGIILKDEIKAAVTVSPEDWWAFASLVSVISLSQLESVFGRARAIRLLHTLWRLGLVEALPEEEVSEPEVADEPSDILEVAVDSHDDEAWLDEIAGQAEKADAIEQVAAVVDRKPLTGVSAPASTVLTGSVLDEMRRLRGRSQD